MMRFARLVTCFVIIVLAGVSRSQAQTTSEPRWFGVSLAPHVRVELRT